jgi:hypothetical protein
MKEGLASAASGGAEKKDNFMKTREEAKRLKEELRESHIFSKKGGKGAANYSNGGEEEEDRKLTTDYREGYQWNATKAKTARTVLSPEVLKRMRASQFVFGETSENGGNVEKTEFISEKEVANKALVAAVEKRKKGGERLTATQEKQKRAALKAKLSNNTYVIGDDDNFMH